ncbi:MAG TPA: TM2 domain-containing protein [Candidatus Saccharimonadia bacterium]|nr:TM2 domain-containing protein [Candidatus Saccharimonadia bacterium]
MSDKKFLPTLLLAIFLGALGGHRFYVGKTGTAVLQLLTCGGVGVWQIIDIIMIAMGTFRDKNGLPLAKE